jgi:hypothetical protein
MEVAEESARLMSNWLAKMEAAMETLENRVISQDANIDHCLDSVVMGDGTLTNPFVCVRGIGSAENPFVVDGAFGFASCLSTLTNLDRTH